MSVTSQDFEVQTLTGISCVIGSVEYAKAVASVKFTPATTINTWKGGTPDAVFTKATKATYSCAMKLGQDYDDAASLANYFMAHAGETVEAAFKFNSGKTITAQLVIVPPEIGGDIDAMLDTTITHGVVGAPVISAS
jgi:hypothetical protein